MPKILLVFISEGYCQIIYYVKDQLLCRIKDRVLQIFIFERTCGGFGHNMDYNKADMLK